MPDVTVTPEVQTVAAQGGIDAAGLHLLSVAIAQANAQADAYAFAHNVPVIDLYSASQYDRRRIFRSPLPGHTFTTRICDRRFSSRTVFAGLASEYGDAGLQ